MRDFQQKLTKVFKKIKFKCLNFNGNKKLIISIKIKIILLSELYLDKGNTFLYPHILILLE